MNLKGHSILFFLFICCFGLYTLYIFQYGRLVLGLAMIPFLDPDQDQMYAKLHRWWFSHSIFPALILTYALSDIVEFSNLYLVVIIFAGYSLVHLVGDLKTNKGFGSIKCWPWKKTINIRGWVVFQGIIFGSSIFFLNYI